MAVVLTPVLAAWFVWGPLGIISYLSGLCNWMWSYASLVYLLWVVPAAVLGFPVLVVYGALTWRWQRASARRSLAVWIILTGGFACPLGLGLAGLSSSPFDLYVRGFTTHMQRADVEAIRGWLGTLDPNAYMVGTFGISQKRFVGAELPPCIADLHPKWATVQPEEGGYLTVSLLWGGGFIGHWGIVVGPEEMPMPPAGRLGAGDRQFPLARGAYLWSGD